MMAIVPRRGPSGQLEGVLHTQGWVWNCVQCKVAVAASCRIIRPGFPKRQASVKSLRLSERNSCLCAGFAGFWANAVAAADAQAPVPADRWDIERAYSPDMASSAMTMYARCAAFVGGAEMFDAGAFRLPRAEAAALDPQQRLLMEEVGCALAHAASTAGDPISSFTGSPSTPPFGPLFYVRCHQLRCAIAADSWTLHTPPVSLVISSMLDHPPGHLQL